jgi:ergothioneine biosynthesis protein EgtB
MKVGSLSATNESGVGEETIDLVRRFLSTRQQTIALIDGLSEEDCVVQAMPDASPLKWHLAHTTWFFEVFVLEKFSQTFKPFDESFKVLFNSYYNGVGEKFPRMQRGMLTRPSLAQVLKYRISVDDQIVALLSMPAVVQYAELKSLLVLGINHEQQHQELMLTDLKYLLSLNPLFPAYRSGWPLISTALPPKQFLEFSGGLVEIGLSKNTVGVQRDFAFDNEGPSHQVFLKPFSLASCPLTYNDVLEFIDAGGYQRPEFWLSMGWDFVAAQSLKAPLYWHEVDYHGAKTWHNFNLRGLCAVSPDVPVPHLSYFEADAIARFKNARLPTQAEWEHAALATDNSITPIKQGNLLENSLFHPTVAHNAIAKDKLANLYGDVWEWTQSSYDAYPGYRPLEGAIGEYNGKFMCNQFVLRGGSCITPRSHIRSSYRNFFPPNAQWQFSGARLARDLD